MQTLTKRKESIMKQLSKSDSLFFLLEVEHLFPEEKEVVCFFGTQSNEDKERVREFEAITSRYYPATRNGWGSRGINPLGCDCGGNFEHNNDYYVCDTCCKISTIIGNSDRSLNRTSNYDRKAKFRECISRYQARQDVLIDKRPYEKYLLRHYGDLSKVTKKQIFYMLVNLSKENQVKHIHLIHYEITGVPPNNIDYLEESLMHDFEVLMGAKPPQRVVSIRQVFYHLLRKNGVACCKEEFGVT